MILDHFVKGETTRISPEGPIPILKITKEDFHLGGAGNVVRNLSSLGVKTDFFSIIGNDVYGKKIRKLLNVQKDVKYQLFTQAGKKTPLKTRFISSKTSGPFSVSQRIPVTGSTSNPYVLRIPTA